VDVLSRTPDDRLAEAGERGFAQRIEALVGQKAAV
jgi:hypothetical protein